MGPPIGLKRVFYPWGTTDIKGIFIGLSIGLYQEMGLFCILGTYN